MPLLHPGAGPTDCVENAACIDREVKAWRVPAPCLRGHVRLAKPVRFRQPWERAASLRLGNGDATVLAEYDQHARIRGGSSEEMTDAAVAGYVALAVEGTDVLLMAADHSLRRKLSRRIRDDLVRLGAVADRMTVAIADGEKAGPGDLIVATRNDRRRRASPAAPSPTATCSASRPSPRAGCSYGGRSARTLKQGAAAGRTSSSCSRVTRTRSWATP
jgi:hypothetical protein